MPLRYLRVTQIYQMIPWRFLYQSLPRVFFLNLWNKQKWGEDALPLFFNGVSHSCPPSSPSPRLFKTDIYSHLPSCEKSASAAFLGRARREEPMLKRTDFRMSSCGGTWSGPFTVHTLQWLWMACVITFCQLYLIAARNLAGFWGSAMNVFYDFFQLLSDTIVICYIPHRHLISLYKCQPEWMVSLYVVSGSLSNGSIIKWGEENNLKN